jgi:hypothetical protein
VGDEEQARESRMSAVDIPSTCFATSPLPSVIGAGATRLPGDEPPFAQHVSRQTMNPNIGHMSGKTNEPIAAKIGRGSINVKITPTCGYPGGSRAESGVRRSAPPRGELPNA